MDFKGQPTPPELRRIYYDRLFPFPAFVKWVSEAPFEHREFSFTIDEYYSRWLSFEDVKDFRKSLLEKNPCKIDIGAAYNVPPKHKDKTGVFKIESKEFVLDIDVTDYQDVRRCGCKEGGMCSSCWPFVQAAVQVMDVALREDFGFKKLLWVYSGRRGMHCWVSDKRARGLENRIRQKMINYLTLDRKQDLEEASMFVHPALQRAYKLLLPHFENTVIRKHNFLGTNEDKKMLGDMIPSLYRSRLLWKDDTLAPYQKWLHFKKNLELVINSVPSPAEKAAYGKVCLVPHRLVLHTLYPRLDTNVSIQMNHLLKSPFSLHPDTGKVCLVVDPKQIHALDPFATVPSMFQLERDLNRSAEEEKPYLQTFQNSVRYFEQLLQGDLTDIEDVVSILK